MNTNHKRTSNARRGSALAPLLAQNIKQRLCGISGTELSRRGQVSQKTVTELLANDQTANPTLRSLEKIARALRVAPWRLLTEQSVPETFSTEDLELLEALRVFDEEDRRRLLAPIIEEANRIKRYLINSESKP